MKIKAFIIVLAVVFLEWLDFSLCLYLAKSIFAQQFFPHSDYSLLLTFALFSMAFLARPLGGWLFGRQSDLYGRRQPLIASSALMGFATLGISLLPSYASIGLWATGGLLFFRIAQGLALGGEMNNSAIFLVEHHPHRPLFIGSFVAAAGALGMFIGGAAAAILQQISLPYLWRFLFAGVALISLWICHLRKQLNESPEFKRNSTTLTQIWFTYQRGLINITFVAFFVSVTVYMCNVFWVSYAIKCHLWSISRCAWTGSAAQLFAALFALPIAYYARPSQANSLLRLSALVAFFSAPLLFYSTTIHYNLGVFVGLGGYVCANALLCSALYYFLYLQLPATYRCRGVSTLWALSASIGALSLPIAEQAATLGWIEFAPAMVSLAAALAFFILPTSS